MSQCRLSKGGRIGKRPSERLARRKAQPKRCAEAIREPRGPGPKIRYAYAIHWTGDANVGMQRHHRPMMMSAQTMNGTNKSFARPIAATINCSYRADLLVSPDSPTHSPLSDNMALTVAHQRTFRPAAASRARCVRVAAVLSPNKATSFVAAAAAALLVSWEMVCAAIIFLHVPLLQEVNCSLTSALWPATADYAESRVLRVLTNPHVSQPYHCCCPRFMLPCVITGVQPCFCCPRQPRVRAGWSAQPHHQDPQQAGQPGPTQGSQGTRCGGTVL
jgi:hypothetical protein